MRNSRKNCNCIHTHMCERSYIYRRVKRHFVCYQDVAASNCLFVNQRPNCEIYICVRLIDFGNVCLFEESRAGDKFYCKSRSAVQAIVDFSSFLWHKSISLHTYRGRTVLIWEVALRRPKIALFACT